MYLCFYRKTRQTARYNQDYIDICVWTSLLHKSEHKHPMIRRGEMSHMYCRLVASATKEGNNIYILREYSGTNVSRDYLHCTGLDLKKIQNQNKMYFIYGHQGDKIKKK